MVLLSGESARGNKPIDVSQHPFPQAEISPKLRRPLRQQCAQKAIFLLTGSTVELPEDMHRTDKPVFMHRVELQCLTQPERGQADERHVVKVNDIILVLFDKTGYFPALKKWNTGEIG
jgi:hypothetical protein